MRVISHEHYTTRGLIRPRVMNNLIKYNKMAVCNKKKKKINVYNYYNIGDKTQYRVY